MEQEGFAVQTACDGLAGLGEMRKRRFDVVIADAHMPGFIGREFAGFCRVGWPDISLTLIAGDLNEGCARRQQGTVRKVCCPI